MDSNKDYYAVLGVLPTAEDAVIRAAYKALAQRYHPDRNDSESAKERMQEINEAYSILSDSKTRSEYDSIRSTQNGSDYDQFQDGPAYSTGTADPLEKEWNQVTEFYPELAPLARQLGNISARLAYTFQAHLLEEKKYEQAKAIAGKMQDEFLATYFGNHPRLRGYALKLIAQKRKADLLALNKAVKLLGPDANPERVINKIEGVSAENNPDEKREHEQKYNPYNTGLVWLLVALSLLVIALLDLPK